MAKYLGKTFIVGIENDCSRENIGSWVKNHKNCEHFPQCFAIYGMLYM